VQGLRAGAAAQVEHAGRSEQAAAEGQRPGRAGRQARPLAGQALEQLEEQILHGVGGPTGMKGTKGTSVGRPCSATGTSCAATPVEQTYQPGGADRADGPAQKVASGPCVTATADHLLHILMDGFLRLLKRSSQQMRGNGPS
jgi:hypothetical protein